MGRPSIFLKHPYYQASVLLLILYFKSLVRHGIETSPTTFAFSSVCFFFYAKYHQRVQILLIGQEKIYNIHLGLRLKSASFWSYTNFSLEFRSIAFGMTFKTEFGAFVRKVYATSALVKFWGIFTRLFFDYFGFSLIFKGFKI